MLNSFDEVNSRRNYRMSVHDQRYHTPPPQPQSYTSNDLDSGYEGSPTPVLLPLRGLSRQKNQTSDCTAELVNSTPKHHQRSQGEELSSCQNQKAGEDFEKNSPAREDGCHINSESEPTQESDQGISVRAERPALTDPALDLYIRDSREDIIQWVNTTENTIIQPSPPASICSQLASITSSAAVSTVNGTSKQINGYSAQTPDHESGFLPQQLDPQSADDGRASDDYGQFDTSSFSQMTDGSGTGESSKGATRSSTSSRNRGNRSSYASKIRPYDGEDGDEPPAKKSGGDQNSCLVDGRPVSPLSPQMPCPLKHSSGCQGTNATISELLRSLQNKHRIVICKDCCCSLRVPDTEKKPENVLQKHVADGCERRCISPNCEKPLDTVCAQPHRRNEKCPSWKALNNQIKWCYLWEMINQEPAPDIHFDPDVGYAHSTELKPCTQQSRTKVYDTYAMSAAEAENKAEKAKLVDLIKEQNGNLEDKNKEIHSLNQELHAQNIELKTARDQLEQLQQQHDNKIRNLDNIIESLMEMVLDQKISLSNSFKKRLRDECPKVSQSLVDLYKPPSPEYNLGDASSSFITSPSAPNNSAASRAVGTGVLTPRRLRISHLPATTLDQTIQTTFQDVPGVAHGTDTYFGGAYDNSGLGDLPPSEGFHMSMFESDQTHAFNTMAHGEVANEVVPTMVYDVRKSYHMVNPAYEP
ncbi:hypothetical protein ACN47E_002983 [Coniothyrium glycines]